MELVSCLNPKRIYNRYTNSFEWVRCRTCKMCLESHAKFWISRIERERKFHRFSFFVTLTYDESHLPVLDFGDFSLSPSDRTWNSDTLLYPSKGDDLRLTYGDFEVLFEDKADKEFFDNRLLYGGIPYVSSRDLQKFLKRLNKHINEKITHKYQNFRYFICSEYGSACFRPHFHGIFFVDDPKLAEFFEQCVLDTWQSGRIDCQPVESNAGSYVANYCNKSEDLPSFYKKGKIRQRFYFSKFPTIGTIDTDSEDLQKLFDNPVATTCNAVDSRQGKLVSVSLDTSIQNKLFPKCFLYGSISDSTRIELYNINSRFNAQSCRQLFARILDFLYNADPITEFDMLLFNVYRDCERDKDKLFNWCKRVYYVSKRVLTRAKEYGVSLFQYYKKILLYWSRKELYVLSEYYRFQEAFEGQLEDLSLMVPEFLYKNFGVEKLSWYADYFDSTPYRVLAMDSLFSHQNHNRTRQKNEYIDRKILKADNPYIYKLIKNYYYAKKCNEID